MKQVLEKLYRHEQLSKAEAKEVLTAIASGSYNDYQVSSFITAFIMRNISLAELQGFRQALNELCIPVDLSAYNPMDMCGTGGDGKNTFNISTLSAFVVAGAGIPIAKHGNYGVSSVSGSSNVLEQLGIKFTNEEQKLQQQIEKASICFLHAPLFHPAMKSVAHIRKGLGVKTFFNMLGPLVNPARPQIQLTGVFNLELARMYQYILQEEGSQFGIVHALDGYDEVSLTGEVKVLSDNNERLLGPEDFLSYTVSPEAIFGGDTVEEAADIFLKILKGNGTAVQNEVVIANSALAIQTYFPEKSLEAAKELAESSLFQQKAFEKLETLKSLS